MEITKKSLLTGKVHTMWLPITQHQLDMWEGGELIQNVMPELSPEEREFLISGITPKEWDEYYGKEEN
jgi:hypothetical protein